MQPHDRFASILSYVHVSTRTLLHGVIALGVTLSITSAVGVSDPGQVRTTAIAVFKPLPDRPPGAEKDTAELVALGKRLYFESRLSKNESQSCNTCHQVDQGRPGADNESTSPGAFGKRGDRNSPTTWNAAFHLAQFWDGRAASLEEQAKGPVLNPVEMAMPSPAEVVQRLQAVPEYRDAFRRAFPGETEALTYENLARAIAAFERTLVSHDRFDEFLKGKNDALTAGELEGLQRFMDAGCTTCHNGPVLGANSYQKSGLVNSYEFEKDRGRIEVTKDDDDAFKFKVPSLRNVALTAPYFHDGKVAALADAVKRMGWMQLGKDLSPDEVQALAAFLGTLSGQGLQPAKTVATR